MPNSHLPILVRMVKLVCAAEDQFANYAIIQYTFFLEVYNPRLGAHIYVRKHVGLYLLNSTNEFNPHFQPS